MELTSLAAVKGWLSLPSSNDDVLLGRLIRQVSGSALNHLQRPSLTRRTYTELRGGSGAKALTLRNWPVVDITSLQIDGAIIAAASSATTAGYTLETWDGTAAGNPQQITLNGYTFSRGNNNVTIVYDAGYCLTDQPYTVMAASPYVISFTPADGSWAQDDGVTYATGVPLTAVQASPAAGQYTVAAGAFGEVTYTFNAADAGAALLISYSYTPAALEQAVIEWIGERYRYKDRIGQSSKSLGGNETAAYSLKGIPDYVAVAFEPFKKFLPL